MGRACVILCCFFAVVMESCGSKNGSGQKVVLSGAQYAKQYSPTRKPGPNAVVVTIADMKFQPQDVTISKGDTVVFNNKDIVQHNVTEEKSNAWSSGPIDANTSWRFVPTKGASYFCSIHPVMKGTITIR